MRQRIMLASVFAFMSAIAVTTTARAQSAQKPAPPQAPASPQASSPSSTSRSPSSPSRLPVRRVILYKSGIGYFEHLGRVSGNDPVSIDFTSAQLNDVLKSLTTIDLGGGRITGINYNSEAPLTRRLGSLGLSLDGDATRTELFDALRGTRLEIQGPTSTAAGRLLSVERQTRIRAGESIDVDELVIVTDSGLVRTVEVTPAVSVRIAEPETMHRVGTYLELIGSARAQDSRRMVISTAGSGERPLFVSYVSEVPIWKTTYRIVLPAASQQERKPLLQGWAVVDNTVGEDWTNVELSLVAGAPQSFIQHVSQPYYRERPVVPLPSGARLEPQTHAAAIMVGAKALGGALAGRVTDETGSGLPGVSVSVRESQAGTGAQVVTDDEGRYQVSGLTPGKYAITFQLEGFQSLMRQGIDLRAGARLDQSVALRIGALTETVAVVAEPATVDTATARIARGSIRRGRAKANVGGSVAMGFATGGLPPEVPVDVPFERAIDTTAAAQDLGDLFEYKIKERISIRKNQSALVPIVNSEIATEKVAIWTGTRGSARPLRALWVTNSSTLTLDGGSFTVIESDAFAGEGLIEPLKPGERRLVSYAVDLGVLVEAKRDPTPMRVSRIVIARGMMTQHSEEKQRVTYTVRNEDTSSRQVIIEHPALPGWKLTGGASPVESAAGWHRFRVPVDSKNTASLTIDEIHPIESRVVIRSLTDAQVTLILRNPVLDASAQQALRAIVAKKAEMAEIAGAISTRDAEVDRIDEEQERLRENMKALKGSAEEKELIQRYTRQLNQHEDRLETMHRERTDLEARQTKAQSELNAMLDALSLDVAVTATPQ